VSLRIFSESISIEDICAKLDTQPTSYRLKGELQSKRNPKSKIREENLWLLKSELDEEILLEHHVERLLLFLKGKVDAIKELQQECSIDIMCGYSSKSGQGGFTLDHKLLEELAKFNVDLSVNLYPPSCCCDEEVGENREEQGI